jgi:hypothetical protein
VRFEGQHFWLALDEAIVKLKALTELGARVDSKLLAIDETIVAFDVLKNVMHAIPAQYKLRVHQLRAAIKKALAA